MSMRKSQSLTSKQKEVLAKIAKFIEEKGQSPTVTELKDMLRVSSLRSVTQYLEALERKGLIVRSRYQSRGIRLIGDKNPQSETVTLAVVGNAGCDNLNIYADQQANEFITLDKDFLQGHDPRQTVVIRAIGDSMVDAGIHSGDLVLAEITKNVQEGEKVVAIINDMAVIKKISFTQNAVVLSPMSPDPQYHQIVMKEDFEISGRVIDIIRNSKNEPEYIYEDIKS